jgi:hypothetical protein
VPRNAKALKCNIAADEGISRLSRDTTKPMFANNFGIFEAEIYVAHAAPCSNGD